MPISSKIDLSFKTQVIYFFCLYLVATPFGAGGFMLFYGLVLGFDSLMVAADDFPLVFASGLFVVTLLELLLQSIAKTSMAKRPEFAIAAAISIMLVFSGGLYFLPFSPRYDVVSELLGFTERHPLAFVAEVCAATCACVTGFSVFAVIRTQFHKRGLVN